jgi:cysteinyl-tRNA synthetase
MEALAAQMYAAGELLGVLAGDPEHWFAGDVDGDMTGDDIEGLIAQRNEARAAKDFQKADAIRDQLAEAGVVIEDGPGGTTWRRGN